MFSVPHFADSVFAQAAQQWDVNRLFADLAVIKQQPLTSAERLWLCESLLGMVPSATTRPRQGSRRLEQEDLSESLWGQIRTLTQQPVQNWRAVARLLDRAGYRSKARLQGSVPDASPAGSDSPTGWATAVAFPGAESAWQPTQNLPIQDFRIMIGREQEIAQLKAWLSYDSSVSRISIEGTGGIGKTALALFVAYHCLREPQSPFQALIFTSAKQQRLVARGIVPRLKPNLHRSLRDILHSIAHTLQQPDLLLGDLETQIQRVQMLLSQRRTLLIVDNLEDVAEYETIVAFLYDLPPTVKVIVTSREQTPFDAIVLEPLPAAQSFALIQQQGSMKQLSLEIAEVERLYHQTSGIPAAIVYAIGQLAAGYPIEYIPERLTHRQSNYARFYFDSSVQSLRETPTHPVLMAMGCFSQAVGFQVIAQVAGQTDLNQVIESLAQLQQRSLLKQQDGRYDMISLTRELTMSELAADPDFERAARERWIAWYLRYAADSMAQNWQDWQTYPDLEAEWGNLRTVIEWCIEHDRYEDVKQFWQIVKGYTHAQGYRIDRRICWNTRLDWTDWLLQAATERQDWRTELAVRLDRGWTLMLLGQSHCLEQSHQLYHQAWQQRHYYSLQGQTDLAIQIAALQIEFQQWSQADHWITEAATLWAQQPQPCQRQQIQIDYHEGALGYKTGQYERAQVQFQQVLQQAELMGWQRAVSLAKNWLADIAIQQHEDLSFAESVFQEGLQIAAANQDTCRAAFCQRSLARLEYARGNRTIARQWAEVAKQEFEQLGMSIEVQETIDLMQAS
ncbi:MAG: NB-ARC domain-containing protein [Elainella sp. Prado103]|nr:NB-ARC domain-containing protein [Elainella sp. Prado103]